MTHSAPLDVDLALLGGGGAASLLLAALDRHGVRGLRIAVVDPVRRRGQDRTWAFWGHPTPTWTRCSARAGTRSRWRPRRDAASWTSPAAVRHAPLRPGLRPGCRAERRLNAIRIVAPAETVRDDGTRVLVRTGDGRGVRAGWVLDSRPRPPARAGRTTWLQHFRGWWLEADRPTFDPTRAVLMDFRTPQPPRGVSFGYVLPVSDRYALVEYTEFSPDLLTDTGYDVALAGYRDLLGLDPAGLRVREVENGVIPMTDAPFPPGRHPGDPARYGRWRDPSLHRLHLLGDVPAGRAGGPRPGGGRPPVPEPAYPRRHRWMDAVALRALDRGGWVVRISSTGSLTAIRPSGCCASSTASPPRPRRSRS
ncbi:lycopene cyclase family protein [Micromonospora sp. M12]